MKKLPVADEVNYTYEVKYDNDSLSNYNKRPADTVTVNADRTEKLTGTVTPVFLRFKQLPERVKEEWIARRRDTLQTMKQAEKDRGRRFIKPTVSESSTHYDSESEAGGAASLERQKKSENQTGSGIKRNAKLIDYNFIPYDVKNHIVYEYFDDPNELCDRLRLLVSSRNAGNTNHMQEINSIVEELRELNCIT